MANTVLGTGDSVVNKLVTVSSSWKFRNWDRCESNNCTNKCKILTVISDIKKRQMEQWMYIIPRFNWVMEPRKVFLNNGQFCFAHFWLRYNFNEFWQMHTQWNHHLLQDIENFHRWKNSHMILSSQSPRKTLKLIQFLLIYISLAYCRILYK